MKKIISSCCLLTLVMGGTLGATRVAVTSCPDLSRSSISNRLLSVTSPFPIQGTAVEGGVCEYKFTARPVDARVASTLPEVPAVHEEKVDKLKDCRTLHIGLAEVEQFASKVPYPVVFPMDSTPGIRFLDIVITQGETKFSMAFVHGFSEDPAMVRKPVVELMRAHNVDTLKFTYIMLGRCVYTAEFPGGRIEVGVR